MTALPSPPTTPAPQDHLQSTAEKAEHRTQNSSASATVGSLTSRIDALLVTYLTHLDAYTIQREQLSHHFRSGFFSLARANTNATGSLGAGRRYGAERYDERIKTNRKVGWQPNTPLEQLDGSYIGQAKSLVGKSVSEVGRPTVTIQSRPEVKELDNNSGDFPDELERLSISTNATQDNLSKPKTQKDPIHQFGILIPQTLRDAQKAFISAVTSSVPEVLNREQEMRRIEEEVSRLRKLLVKAEEADRSNQKDDRR
ncbi:MAG: hypothetical protein Q9227_003766 [Pyrenula ochraceoflavens]